MTSTVRLTVGQAVVRFLAAQWTERDGERQKLFAGCFGIFGHGNVAGLGQALLQNELADGRGGHEEHLPYVLARNEQAMVHTSVAYARQKDRLQTGVGGRVTARSRSRGPRHGPGRRRSARPAPDPDRPSR